MSETPKVPQEPEEGSPCVDCIYFTSRCCHANARAPEPLPPGEHCDHRREALSYAKPCFCDDEDDCACDEDESYEDRLLEWSRKHHQEEL